MMKPNSLFKGKYTKKALFAIVPIILCIIVACVLLVSLNDRSAQTANTSESEMVANSENPEVLSSERGNEEDMDKLYERINFENAPSKKTPLNEENLNKIDGAIDALDDRTIQIANDLETANIVNVCDIFPLYVNGLVRANGTINTTNTDWGRTDYISVYERITFSISNATRLAESVGFNIAYFDENQNFVSGFSFAEDGVYNTTVDVPNGVEYVIITNLKANNTETDYVKTLNRGASKQNYIVVSVDGSGDYTNVTEAVNNAVDGDVIFVKSGNYTNEHIKGWGKTLSIIGENPLNTVLSCGDSTYGNPVLEFSSGVLKNLTVKINSGNGYAFHCEDDFQFNKTLFVENCIFSSYKQNSVGMGMRGGCKIVFKDCQFLNTENQGACFYLHDANEEAYKGTFDIEFVNCLFSNLGNYIMSLQSQELDGSIVNFGFVNCRFYGNGSSAVPYISVTNYRGGTSSNSADWNGLINWRLKPTSNGNNLTALNVLPTYSGIATN